MTFVITFLKDRLRAQRVIRYFKVVTSIYCLQNGHENLQNRHEILQNEHETLQNGHGEIREHFWEFVSRTLS